MLINWEQIKIKTSQIIFSRYRQCRQSTNHNLDVTPYVTRTSLNGIQAGNKLFSVVLLYPINYFIIKYELRISNHFVAKQLRITLLHSPGQNNEPKGTGKCRRDTHLVCFVLFLTCRNGLSTFHFDILNSVTRLCARCTQFALGCLQTLYNRFLECSVGSTNRVFFCAPALIWTSI